MLPVVHPALVFVLGLQLALVFLVVQVGGADLAFAALGQVAELTLHQQAALGHVGRVEGGVVVRRQVEVVGRRQREAGVAGGADTRSKEAGLAAIVDREIDVGGVEDRNVFHPQGHVGRGTEAGGGIQLDVVAFQVPGVAARFTTGKGAVLEADHGALFALGVERAAAYVALVDHVFGVLDLGLAIVQLDLGAVADHQHAVVANAHIAFQLAAVLGLVQGGFVGLDLHARLAQDHVTGQGSGFLFLLVARGLGRNEGRRLVHWRVVVHPRAQRLDVGALAVGADFRQLGGSQLLARYPVEVAVVGAAAQQGATTALGHQYRLLALGLAAGGLGIGRRGADGVGAMLRTRHRGSGVALRRAGPAAGGGGAAVVLLGSDGERRGQRLQSQQAAGHQQREFFTEQGEFYCHLVFPGFLRAFDPRGPHASRWAEKDAG